MSYLSLYKALWMAIMYAFLHMVKQDQERLILWKEILQVKIQKGKSKKSFNS